jgi:hypothetical protein
MMMMMMMIIIIMVIIKVTLISPINGKYRTHHQHHPTFSSQANFSLQKLLKSWKKSGIGRFKKSSRSVILGTGFLSTPRGRWSVSLSQGL